MNALRGSVVFLTGATGGIGAPLAAALARAGATVVAIGRDASRLQVLAAQSALGAVRPLCADLGSREGRDAVLAQARLTPPTTLVMAHAQSAFGLFAEQSDAELERLMHVNLVAPMLLVRALLPILSRQPSAAVVAVGSTFGSLGFPGFAAYSASKFGLRGLIESLGREHADGPVAFQYLSPRATRTPFNSAAVEALNRELGTAQDEPAAVAAELLAAIERGDRRRQLGWPEKFFARLNGAFPALVDRALRPKLSTIRRHACATSTTQPEIAHETP
jgi:short-subunit dehydrogenase